MKRLLIALFFVSSMCYAQQDKQADIIDRLKHVDAQLNLLLNKNQIEKDCALYVKDAGYKNATLGLDYEAGLWFHSDLGEWWSVGCRIYIKDLLESSSDYFAFMEVSALHEKYGGKSKIKSKKNCGE